MPDFGTIIDGAARSDNVNLNGLPIDMESRTELLEPSAYIFEALTRKFGKKVKTSQTKHEYRERRPIPNYCTVTAASAAGASSITVSNYDRIKNDFLLYNPRTAEMMLVQDASIDASVTIVRAATGTGTLQYATEVGDQIDILGEAHAEGEAVPDAYTNISVDVYDYVMQRDRLVQQTDIEEAIAHYDPREARALDRKTAWIEYKRDQSLLYYVGQRSRETTSASGPRRHVCSGVIEKFTENSVDLSGAGSGMTVQTLSAIMGATKFFGAGSNFKVGLFGTKGWDAISAWPENYLRVSPNVKEWGVGEISRILTGYGPIDVAFDSVLTAERGLADRGVVLDPKWIRQLYLRTLPVRMLLNINNAVDIHNIKDAITGTFAIQAKLNELHAQIEGVS